MSKETEVFEQKLTSITSFNKENCINCQNKIIFDNDTIRNLNFDTPVQNTLQETQTNFILMMEKILCLCKQHVF